MLHYERALATQVSTNGANSNAGGRHDGPARLLRLAAGELRHALRSLPDDTAQRGRLAHVLVINIDRKTKTFLCVVIFLYGI